MPTELTRNVARNTTARIYEKGKNRNVVLALIAPAKIGVRLSGTRQTYQIDAEAVYSIAVKLHLIEVEKRAKAIAKATKTTMRSARAKARKDLAGTLKI